MKDIVVTILEDYLYAVCKEKNGKMVYYLKGKEHFESGKSFTFVQFISQKDFEAYFNEFKKAEK